jgi:hypothetical protein
MVGWSMVQSIVYIRLSVHCIQQLQAGKSDDGDCLAPELKCALCCWAGTVYCVLYLVAKIVCLQVVKNLSLVKIY